MLRMERYSRFTVNASGGGSDPIMCILLKARMCAKSKFWTNLAAKDSYLVLESIILQPVCQAFVFTFQLLLALFSSLRIVQLQSLLGHILELLPLKLW